MIIYKTTNLINGLIYIGKDQRNDKNYLGSGTNLKAAIKEFGKNNFKKEIIEECTLENINERERYWIAFYKSREPQIGYNIAAGGCGMDIFGDNPRYSEVRKRMAEAQKEVHSRPEYKEKLRNSIIDATSRREFKDKMSVIVKKRFEDPEYVRNQSEKLKISHARPEFKARMSEVNKELYERPGFREKHSASIRISLDKPEYRAKASAIQKEIQNRPEVRKAKSERNKDKVVSAESRKRMSDAQKEFYSIPENLEKKRIDDAERAKKRRNQKPMKQKEEKQEYSGEYKRHSENTKNLWENQEFREKVKANRKKALDEGRGKKSSEAIKAQQERLFKKVYQYDTEWNLIKIWESMKSVKEHYGDSIIKRWKIVYLDTDKLMEGSYWRSTAIENIG